LARHISNVEKKKAPYMKGKPTRGRKPRTKGGIYEKNSLTRIDADSSEKKGSVGKGKRVQASSLGLSKRGRICKR